MVPVAALAKRTNTCCHMTDGIEGTKLILSNPFIKAEIPSTRAEP
jgi:hypothetical protein